MVAQLPDNACCTGCGYRLRGLPEPLCPECGRRFDPDDPTTFVADPTRRRQRQWVKRGAVALAIVVLLVAFGPRRILRSKMTFTCTQCARTLSFSRWEPKPPDWIPLRYPGWRWRSQTAASTPQTSCAPHRYGVKVQFDLYNGGSCTGSEFYKTGAVTTFNGLRATPSSAHRILTALTAPGNNGISVASAVAVSDEPDP